RETARSVARGEVLAYVDADCRAPLRWLELVEQQMLSSPRLVGVTGPYRFYDWDISGRVLIRLYDVIVAPATHVLLHHAFGLGAILYGGNFAVRRMRSRASGASTARSSFTAKTPISDGGSPRSAAYGCRAAAGCGRPRGDMWRWGSGACFL